MLSLVVRKKTLGFKRLKTQTTETIKQSVENVKEIPKTSCCRHWPTNFSKIYKNTCEKCECLLITCLISLKNRVDGLPLWIAFYRHILYEEELNFSFSPYKI
jgi:hypothetical protein